MMMMKMMMIEISEKEENENENEWKVPIDNEIIKLFGQFQFSGSQVDLISSLLIIITVILLQVTIKFFKNYKFSLVFRHRL
jgi:hypothetical protein